MLLLDLLSVNPPIAPEPPWDLRVHGELSEYLFFAANVLVFVGSVVYAVIAGRRSTTSRTSSPPGAGTCR